jgi:FkbM family methyltransferase
MNSFLRAIDRTVAVFNGLPIWKGQCRVWGQCMASPTFERWLYLRMHRLGFMGRNARSFLENHISPGMRIVDIGANLGLYSVLMARLAGPTGRVIAFEPDPELFASLQQNARLNGVRVEGHNLALGAAAGELTLHKSIINSGDNHLGALETPLFRRAVATTVVRLDDVLPQLAVDLIKIDVQGWELEVLRGMGATLAANPSVQIYFEFCPNGYARAGSSYGELIAFLRNAGLRIFATNDSTELDDAGIKRLAASFGRNGYANLLAAR